jgi:hypothetical protein
MFLEVGLNVPEVFEFENKEGAIKTLRVRILIILEAKIA